MGQDKEEVEERPVSKEELQAGVKAKAGHRLVLLVGGVPGSGSTPGDASGPGSADGSGPGDGSGGATGGDASGPGTSDASGPGTSDASGPGTSDGSGGTGTAPADDAGALDLQLVNPAGKPVPDLEVELTLDDGSKRAGKTDKDGHFKLASLKKPGQCKLEVPDVQAPEGGGAPPAQGRLRYSKGMALDVGTTPVVELPPRVRRGTLTGAHFETDKTFLLPSAMKGIRELRGLYETYGAMSLLVSGHTDTVGDAAYNLGLSVERAESIAAFLTDAVPEWTKRYQKQPHSAAWGVREDQYMLATLPEGGTPFYGAKVDGEAGPKTSDAYKQFQAGQGLPQSGRGDEATRAALVKAYMSLDGTTLPKEAKVATHGCGLTHLAQPTGPGVASLANRRVELFLFEGDPAPPPQTPCPSGGCPEYPQWEAQAGTPIDLDQPPATITVSVLDEKGAGIDGARVHAAGPTSHDEVAKDGKATFADRVPGHYKLIAEADGFQAADTELDAASGATATATLTLKERPPMEIEFLGLRLIKADGT